MATWQQLPLLMLVFTGFQVAGMPAIQGSAVSQVLGVIRTVLVAALVIVVMVVAVMVLRIRFSVLSEPSPAPRPRWQYLLAAVGYFAVASCLALAGAHALAGLPSRFIAAAGVWSGVYGLVMIGRAVLWGHPRALLWWRPFLQRGTGHGTEP